MRVIVVVIVIEQTKSTSNCNYNCNWTYVIEYFNQDILCFEPYFFHSSLSLIDKNQTWKIIKSLLFDDFDQNQEFSIEICRK